MYLAFIVDRIAHVFQGLDGEDGRPVFGAPVFLGIGNQADDEVQR